MYLYSLSVFHSVHLYWLCSLLVANLVSIPSQSEYIQSCLALSLCWRGCCGSLLLSQFCSCVLTLLYFFSLFYFFCNTSSFRSVYVLTFCNQINKRIAFCYFCLPKYCIWNPYTTQPETFRLKDIWKSFSLDSNVWGGKTVIYCA